MDGTKWIDQTIWPPNTSVDTNSLFNSKNVILIHCPMCPFFTFNYKRLLDHLSASSHSGILECVFYRCSECNKISTSSLLLKEHFSNEHPESINKHSTPISCLGLQRFAMASRSSNGHVTCDVKGTSDNNNGTSPSLLSSSSQDGKCILCHYGGLDLIDHYSDCHNICINSIPSDNGAMRTTVNNCNVKDVMDGDSEHNNNNNNNHKNNNSNKSNNDNNNSNNHNHNHGINNSKNNNNKNNNNNNNNIGSISNSHNNYAADSANNVIESIGNVSSNAAAAAAAAMLNIISSVSARNDQSSSNMQMSDGTLIVLPEEPPSKSGSGSGNSSSSRNNNNNNNGSSDISSSSKTNNDNSNNNNNNKNNNNNDDNNNNNNNKFVNNSLNINLTHNMNLLNDDINYNATATAATGSKKRKLHPPTAMNGLSNGRSDASKMSSNNYCNDNGTNQFMRGNSFCGDEQQHNDEEFEDDEDDDDEDELYAENDLLDDENFDDDEDEDDDDDFDCNEEGRQGRKRKRIMKRDVPEMRMRNIVSENCNSMNISSSINNNNTNNNNSSCSSSRQQSPGLKVSFMGGSGGGGMAVSSTIAPTASGISSGDNSNLYCSPGSNMLIMNNSNIPSSSALMTNNIGSSVHGYHHSTGSGGGGGGNSSSSNNAPMMRKRGRPPKISSHVLAKDEIEAKLRPFVESVGKGPENKELVKIAAGEPFSVVVPFSLLISAFDTDGVQFLKNLIRYYYKPDQLALFAWDVTQKRGRPRTSINVVTEQWGDTTTLSLRSLRQEPFVRASMQLIELVFQQAFPPNLPLFINRLLQNHRYYMLGSTGAIGGSGATNSGGMHYNSASNPLLYNDEAASPSPSNTGSNVPGSLINIPAPSTSPYKDAETRLSQFWTPCSDSEKEVMLSPNSRVKKQLLVCAYDPDPVRFLRNLIRSGLPAEELIQATWKGKNTGRPRCNPDQSSHQIVGVNNDPLELMHTHHRPPPLIEHPLVKAFLDFVPKVCGQALPENLGPIIHQLLASVRKSHSMTTNTSSLSFPGNYMINSNNTNINI